MQQLRLAPRHVARVVRYGRDYSASLFLNPGKLRGRLQSYRRLELEFPGLCVSRLLSHNPILLTHTARTLRRKLELVADVLPASGGASPGGAATRCPSLLTRSPGALAAVRASLVSRLGLAAADVVAARYPGVYSRSVVTLEAAIDDVARCWGGDAAAVARLLAQNPALATRTGVADKVLRIAQEARVSFDKVGGVGGGGAWSGALRHGTATQSLVHVCACEQCVCACG